MVKRGNELSRVSIVSLRRKGKESYGASSIVGAKKLHGVLWKAYITDKLYRNHKLWLQWLELSINLSLFTFMRYS
jgi:hypothetical protein